MMNAPLSVSRGASVAGAFCACVAGCAPGCPGCGCCCGFGGSGSPPAGATTLDGAIWAASTALAASAIRIKRRSDKRRIELFLFGSCFGAGLGLPQGGLFAVVQFRLLLLPLPDAERSLLLKVHHVAVFRGLHADAAGGRHGSVDGRGVLPPRNAERSLAIEDRKS